MTESNVDLIRDGMQKNNLGEGFEIVGNAIEKMQRHNIDDAGIRICLFTASIEIFIEAEGVASTAKLFRDMANKIEQLEADMEAHKH